MYIGMFLWTSEALFYHLCRAALFYYFYNTQTLHAFRKSKECQRCGSFGSLECFNSSLLTFKLCEVTTIGFLMAKTTWRKSQSCQNKFSSFADCFKCMNLHRCSVRLHSFISICVYIYVLWNNTYVRFPRFQSNEEYRVMSFLVKLKVAVTRKYTQCA